MVCILEMHNVAEIGEGAVITVKDNENLTSTGENDQHGLEQYTQVTKYTLSYNR